MKNPESKIKKILSFNHYGQKGIEFHDEGETLVDFFEFLKPYQNPLLVIQNAEFDMRFLNTRNPIVKFDNEVMDTKQISQLFYLPCLQKLAEEKDEVQRNDC
jgi:DNA polymerase III epsilon subunit-like protein